jgi:hypothetical protein
VRDVVVPLIEALGRDRKIGELRVAERGYGNKACDESELENPSMGATAGEHVRILVGECCW